MDPETQVSDVDVDADVDSTSADEGNSDDGGDQADEPFLSVNERTVYKTREDALRGFNEAGQRIASLSGWEKAGKEYGIDNPRHLKPLFDELLELRQIKQRMEKEGAEGGQKQPTHSDADASLSKEEKQARDYLRKVLPQIGYVPKEDLMKTVKELQAAVEGLQQQGTQSQETYFRNQEATAREQLNTWLGDAGIEEDADGNKARIVGSVIKDWINSDDELVERWSQGGVEAMKLVREGFDLAMKALGWGVAKPGAGNAGAKYAADKAKAVAANKKLPAPGTSGKKPVPDAKRRLASGQIDHIGSAHERAWKLFQEKSAEK